VWVLVGAGGVNSAYPLWVNGNTYLDGGSYRCDSNSATAGYAANPYTESGQPPAYMVAPWIAFGSATPQRAASNAFQITSTTTRGVLTPFQMASRADNTGAVTITPTFEAAADEVMRVDVTGDGANGFSNLTWDSTNGDWCVRHRRIGTRTPIRFTTDLNTLTGGRGAAIGGGQVFMSQGLWIGSTTSLSRLFDTGTAAPAANEQAQGEVRFKTNSGAGGFAGWYCTAGGTPGTFQPFGMLNSVSADKGNASATLTAGTSDTTNVWNTPSRRIAPPLSPPREHGPALACRSSARPPPPETSS
jgi:hypothetical protein